MKKIINVEIENNEIIIYEKNNKNEFNIKINIYSDSVTPFEKINDFILKNINNLEIDFSNLENFKDKDSTIFKITKKICETYEEEIKAIKDNMGINS